MTEANLGKKGFVLAFTSTSVCPEGKSRQELKAGSLRQKLKDRLWRKTVYCLALHHLLSCFHIQAKTTCLGVVHHTLPALQIILEKASCDIQTMTVDTQVVLLDSWCFLSE